MSYLSELMDPDASPQTRLLWAALGVLVAAQLFAFWLLCSHQVRKAEARHSEAVVQQMALADCLQYIPGSTIASCTRGPVRTAAHAQNGAVPVSYTYR
jgi:hypothetical protein